MLGISSAFEDLDRLLNGHGRDRALLDYDGPFRISRNPAHIVVPEFTAGLHGVSEPLHLAIPQIRRREFPAQLPRQSEEAYTRAIIYWSRLESLNPSWGSYFSQAGHLLRSPNSKARLRKFLESLNSGSPRRPATIVRVKDSLRITPGIRRTSGLSEETISRGLYLHQCACDIHTIHTPYPTFYPECIAPHLVKSKAQTPIEWAAERLTIVHGYAIGLAGSREFQVDFAEYPYKKMASAATNIVPNSLITPRDYKLNPEIRETLRNALKACGGNIIAEGVILIVENLDCFKDSAIQPEVVALIKALPRALQNGLVIDRVSELARHYISRKIAPPEAMRHAAIVTCAVYAGDLERPWWFKEDFDLRPDKRTTPSRPEVEKLAQRSGFAFQYAQAVYAKIGPRLMSVGHLSCDQAIDLCCQVTLDYGIGNVFRAINVLELALGALAESPIGQIEASLRTIKHTCRHYRPVSEVIGVLGGSDVNFPKAGLFSLLKSLGDPASKKRNMHEVSIGPEEIRSIGRRLDVPLAKRASLRPALQKHLRTDHLLTQSRRGPMLLPSTESPLTCGSLERPVLSWFKFDSQLRSECPKEEELVANLYFAFFATKFPDPFAPPSGFLRFLLEFHRIPNPKHRASVLAAPNERDKVDTDNAQLAVDRYSIISNLLDGWNSGLVTWDQLSELFRALTQPTLPGDLAKKVEVDALWDRYWRHKEHIAACAEMAAEADAEISRAQARIAEARAHDDWIDPDDTEIIYGRQELLQGAEEELQEALRRDPFENEDTTDNDADQAKYRIEERIRLERLARLEAGMQAVVILNRLADTRLVDNQVVSDIYANFLTTIQREIVAPPIDLVLDDFEPIEKDKTPRFDPTLFDELSGKDFLHVDVLAARLQQCGSVEDYTRLAGDLERLQSGFTQASRILSGPNAGLAAQPMLWPARYAQVLRRVDDFRRRLLHLPDESKPPGKLSVAVATNKRMPTDKVVNQASQQVIAAWSFIRCAQIFDTHENPSLASGRVDTILESKLPTVGNPITSPLHRLSEALGAPIPLFNRDGVGKSTAVSTLYTNLENELEPLIEAVIAHRRAAFGLLPVGGKIHVSKQIDSQRFESLRKGLGISQTSFTLLHAGHSLLLPPMPSAAEIALIVGLLDSEKIIDWAEPELQMGGPGRLGALDCAVLGATILLTTRVGTRYSPEAFFAQREDHKVDTGCRIVAYDDNGPRSEFRFQRV